MDAELSFSLLGFQDGFGIQGAERRSDSTLSEADPAKFKQSAAAYRALRRRFLEELSENDRKYFSFQLWQEGMARYTQIKAAEAAMTYKPSSQFAALPDFTSFAEYGRGARSETIGELRDTELQKAGRTALYSFGAVEGLLLDRIAPKWKDRYFQHLLSTAPLFEAD